MVGSSTAVFEAVVTPSKVVLTLGSSTTVTARGGSPITVGSFTLSVGGDAATIGEEVLSMNFGEVVISNTASTYTTSFTSAPGIGDAINSGLQGASNPGTTGRGIFDASPTSIEAVTETASQASVSSHRWIELVWTIFAFACILLSS